MWASIVAEYAWLRPYLLVTAGLSFLAGVACFLWPWFSSRKATRYESVCEALDPFVMGTTRRDWLARLLTGARPEPYTQLELWNALQEKGIVESDSRGRKGLVSGFEPALEKWLREHPSDK
jgi:hypothetical protein